MSLTLPPTLGAFRHEAFTYRGDEEYLAGTVPFIEEGLADGDAVLVAVPQARIALLAVAACGAQRRTVCFVPMEEAGRNPARLLATWADFVAARSTSTSTSTSGSTGACGASASRSGRAGRPTRSRRRSATRPC